MELEKKKIAYTEKQLLFRDETKLPLCLAAYWDNNSNSFPCGIHDAKLKISLPDTKWDTFKHKYTNGL